MRKISLDFLEKIGSVASIIGLYVLFVKDPTAQLVLASLLISGVLGLIGMNIYKRKGPVRVGRDQMIGTGIRLILGAKREVIIFAGDMSWANDYEESVRTITSKNKSVSVVYSDSQAEKVIRNKQILLDAGAKLIPVPIDNGLRAMIIDPDDHDDALLFVANRTLKLKALPVEVGERGSEENYEYIAKVYDMAHDEILIKTVIRVYNIMSTQQRKNKI